MGLGDEDRRNEFRIVALVLLENITGSNAIKFDSFLVCDEKMGRINTPANGIDCGLFIDFPE